MAFGRKKKTEDATEVVPASAPVEGAGKAAGGEAKTTPKPTPTGVGPGAKDAGAAKPGEKASSTAPPAAPATGSHTVAPTLGEVDERSRGTERKLGTRTYAGAATLILALAAAIVGIVLAIDARDNSAPKSDVTRLEEQISDVSAAAGVGEDAQEGVDSLETQVSDLETRLDQMETDGQSANRRISVLEDDIEDLRQQISDLETSSGGTGSGSTAAGDGISDPP